MKPVISFLLRIEIKIKYFIFIAFGSLNFSINAASNETCSVSVPSMELSDALILLSVQCGCSIGFNEIPKTSWQTRPLTGVQGIETSIQYLIQGSPYQLTQFNEYYIVKPIAIQNNNTVADKTIKQNNKESIQEVFVYGTPNENETITNGHYSFRENTINNKFDDIQDLSLAVPSVFTASKSALSKIYIRGSGIDDDSDLTDPLVPIYFNEILLIRPGSLSAALYDLEAVDIFVGPRISERPRGTVAGDVSLQTVRPQWNSNSIEINADTGSFQRKRLEFATNFQPTNKLASRLSGLKYEQNSWYKNSNPSAADKHIKTHNDRSLRSQWLYKITPNWHISSLHEYQEQKGLPKPGSNLTSYLTRAKRGPINPPDSSTFIPKVTDTENAKVHTIVLSNHPSYDERTTQINQIGVDFRNYNSLAKLKLSSSKLHRQSHITPDLGIDISQSNLYYLDFHLQGEEPLNQYDAFDTEEKSRINTLTLAWKKWGDSYSGHTQLYYFDEDLQWFYGHIEDKGYNFLGQSTYSSSNRKFLSLEQTIELSVNRFVNQQLSLRYTLDSKHRRGIFSRAGGDWQNQRLGTPGFQWNKTHRKIFNIHGFFDPGEKDINGAPVINGSPEDFETLTQREQWEAFADSIHTFGTHDTVNQTAIENKYSNAEIYFSQLNDNIKSEFFDIALESKYRLGNTQNGYTKIVYAHTPAGFNNNLSSEPNSNYQKESAFHIEAGWHYNTESIHSSLSLFNTIYNNKIVAVDAPRSVTASLITPEKSSNFLNGNYTSTEGEEKVRLNIPKAKAKGIDWRLNWEIFPSVKLRSSIEYLITRFDEGVIPDARMAPNSPFVNADPLRFNTPETTIKRSDSNEYFIHSLDAFDFNPYRIETQRRRPGIDMNGDGKASHYFSIDCSNSTSSAQAPDAQCFSNVTGAPEIEYPLRNIRGNQFPRAPRWVANIALEKTFYSDAWRWVIYGEARYRGTHYLTVYNGTGVEPRPFADSPGLQTVDEAPSFYDKTKASLLLNAGVSLGRGTKQRWQISLHATNITNRQIMTDVNISPWSYTAWYNPPRAWRLALKTQIP